MKNNYNKLLTLVTLLLMAFSSHALLQRGGSDGHYFIWTYYNVAAGDLDPELKALSRQDTPHFWNSGEPNNSSNDEHCATQTKNGGWNDLSCGSSNPVACFNGESWAVSTTSVSLNNNADGNRAGANNACPTGYQFAAPMNAEQKAALDAVIPSGNVWINAFDNTPGMGKEGVWVFNRGIEYLFGLNWAANEPSVNTTNQCMAMDNAGLLHAEDCSNEYPVVCTTQNWDDKVIVGNTANTGSVDLNHICQTEGRAPAQGQSKLWWNFAAPRTSIEKTAVQSVIPAGSKAWINANGNQVGNAWQFNLGLTNWAAGEPNFGNDNEKQCAVARQDGQWEMASCDDEAYILCSDGDSWEARQFKHQFSNQAYEACSRPDTDKIGENKYLSYQLKTPVTEADRKKAADALKTMGTNKAWLNMKYIRDTEKWYINESYNTLEFAAGSPKTKVWYNVFQDGSNKDTVSNVLHYETGASLPLDQALQHNQGIPTYFAHEEPNGSRNIARACSGTECWFGGDKNYGGNTDRVSCIHLAVASGLSWAKPGQWDDTSCNNSKYAACSDGFEWRVSPTAVNLGADVDADEDVSIAHNACAEIEKNGVKGNFRFAAPASFAESQSLLNVAATEGHQSVWINMHSKKYWRAFVINQGVTFQAPFWNSGEPNNAGDGEDCAVQQRTAGWNDVSCSTPYPVACYDPFDGDNGKWQITDNSHAYKDASNAEASIEDFNLKCQAEFTGRYKFYAPITQSHQSDLKQVMEDRGLDNVHINANDITVEDSWTFNTHVNNWESDQPSNLESELCVSANATTSRWRTRSCDEELPVVCSSGARWYFTENKVSLSEYANAEKACFAEFGAGYSFAAPRTLDSALLLQYFAKIEGLGGDFWINGNRLEKFDRWTWNADRLSTPVWGYGNQPDGGTAENCAVINNNDEGSWDDERCDRNNFAYLCRKGDSWSVTAATGALDDFSKAVTECAGLGDGWVFAAPTTYNENLAAKNAMGSNAKVWVNATDAVTEGTWLLNAAPIAEYPLWGDIEEGHCLYQDDQGRVSAVDCTGAQESSWACSDGYNWKVTKSEGRIQKFADGHKACLTEYGANYMFAAPLGMNDTIQLDFARLQAASDRNNPVNKVWINMTTAAASPFISEGGRAFRRNLPFSNWRDFDAGEEPLPTLCAYKNTSASGTNNPWRTASCSNFAAHYACTDGDTWRIALSKGRLIGEQVQLAPQVGEDYWSYERGNALCKEQHGPSFFFSAPVSAAEELALDAAIRRSPANVKDVWLNYYGVSAISGHFLSDYEAGDINRGDGLWFANRLKLGTWQKPDFNNMNNADCALLHADGTYTDTSCSNNSLLEGNQTTYPFACFNGVEWSVAGDGYWIDGFNACENNNNSMFAVPRTPDELDELVEVMGAHEKVWINLNDTAQEGQWIANRLQYSWWAAGEPRNDFNKDCAKVSAGKLHPAGEWFAARCSLEIASFACRTTTAGSSGSTIRWDITEATGEWSEGFGACAQEFPGSEYIAPQGFGIISGTEDQDILSGVVVAPDKGNPRDVWINLSDQEVEGAWRGHQAYSNWGVDSLFDQGNDCAYIDTKVLVQPGKGNWFADSCKYTSSTPVKRGYSCTDGSTWKIVEAESTDMRWSSGYEACQNAYGEGWQFAAPTNAVQNRQLEIAMKLAGVEQLWINAHDRINEGYWQINGPEINFPPAVDVSATAAVVNENTANIELKAILEDEEETGIDASKTTWELVSNKGAISGEEIKPAEEHLKVTVTNVQVVAGANGSATVTANYSTPVLFKEDRLLTFKLNATDNGSGTSGPATSETFVNVRVKAPLIAAYDFESSTRPNRDITGHGHDILASTMSSAQVVSETTNKLSNRALKLSPDSRLRVLGKANDADNGLDFGADEYTIAFRISIEDLGSKAFRGILQKGSSTRNPAFILYEPADAGDNYMHTSSTPTTGGNRDVNTYDEAPDAVNTPLNKQQWLNVYYVKTATDIKLYIDDYSGDPLAKLDITGKIADADGGDLYIGDIPAAGESFIGLIDDIHLFNREIPTSQFGDILPPLPIGEVGFVESSAVVDEFEDGNANYGYNIAVERRRGSAEELTIYVNHLSGSAARGNLADMATATHPADFAFADSSYDSNTGVPVTWAAGERGVKTVELVLDNADDDLREGTETAVFGVSQLADARAVVKGNEQFTLYINDLTPNAYGNFAVGVKNGSTLVSEKLVIETDSTAQQICFVRDIGSYAGEAKSDVTVHFTISGNAVDKAQNSGDHHYEMNGTPFPSDGRVVFADKDSAEKCFNVTPVANSSNSDHNLKVSISHLESSDANHEALISDGMQSANLIIQDYNPGSFAFDASSYRCFEEIDEVKNELVPTWAQRPASSKCEIVVKRSGTGTNAPDAKLNFSVGSNSYNLNGSTLEWPAVSSANPANPMTENQVVTFEIDHDDIQNGDEEIALTLTAVNGEVLDAGKDMATLTIQDVTTPAVITVSNGSVDEGAQATFTAVRSGNLNTYFDMNYEVEVVASNGNPLPNPAEYYIDTQGALLSNTVNWAVGEESKTYSFIAKNTDANVKVLLNLSTTGRPASDARPSDFGRDDVVGLGAIDKAGAGEANTYTAELEVNNTLDTIASNMTVTVRDTGGDSEAQPAQTFGPNMDSRVIAANSYLAVTKTNVPQTRELELDIKLPAGKNIGNANYKWTLLNADGSTASWDDGVGGVTDSTGTSRFVSNGEGVLNYTGSELTQTARMKLPFSLEGDSFLLKVEVDGNFEKFSKTVEVKVDMLWRRLRNNSNSNCMRSWGSIFNSCGDVGQWNDLYMTWQPEKNRLIDKETWENGSGNHCFEFPGGNNRNMVSCTANNSNATITLSNSVHLRIGSDYVCMQTAVPGNINRGGTGFFDACGDSNRRTWTWLD